MAYDPTNGERPLDTLPLYGGAGGSQQATDYYAAQDFYKQFGRNPTQSELSMLSSAYQSGDPNVAGLGQGRSAVGQYYNSLANTPDNQAAQKQKQYEADAPKFYDQINGQFNSVLGRDATKDEKSHFGSLMASGNVDGYTIGQFLNALPENVQKQDAEFRKSLNTELQGQDSQYFKEQVLPGVQSTFANQGRDFRSSGFENSVAQAATQQNRQRESFLSNLSSAQYGGSQALAQQAYNQAYQGYQGLQDFSRQRAAQLQDASTNRVNDIQNYAMQKQAYDQYLRGYGKRSNGVGALIGGTIGTGVGAYFGGPAGAKAGYGIGSGFGEAAQSA